MAKKSKEKPELEGAELPDDQEVEFGSQMEALGYPSHEDLEEKLNEVEAKLDEAQKEVLSLHAELDNTRKRAEKDQLRIRKYGIEKVILEMLPIADSLEQGLARDAGDSEFAASMKEGLQLTLDLMLKALAKFSVTPIDPQGEVFDPERHEAMSMQETDDAAPNTVLQVFQKGYLLEDRLVRPALVVVAKGK